MERYPEGQAARRLLAPPRSFDRWLPMDSAMNVFELTRSLIDIESITPNEERVGVFLHDYLAWLASRFKGTVERIEVEPHRFNIFAQFGDVPLVTLSTHMDTVPPYFPSGEDDQFITGRGACDTKGIIASMIHAAEQLLENGERDFGLLFVVGEERNSAGALHAAKHPRGSRFLINGEPTGNKLALGSKGALRYEITARGRMAHSAYPELGESAILKLLDVLNSVRAVKLPVDEILGPSTLNIGTLSGGRAPNVIPDEARAEIFIRLVCESAPTRALMEAAVGGRAELQEVLEIPALRLGSLSGFETDVMAYTTDIPAFAGKWGTPFLLGPGTIHVAHTLNERVPKQELLEAIEIYQRMVRRLKHEQN
jgi:acetylornithine deacetylase